MRDIGKNIRDLREQCGLTQEEMAEKLFVTRQTISNYETGKTRPDVDMIIKIAEVLKTDPNAVFYGAPVPQDKRIMRKQTIIATIILLLLAGIILLFGQKAEDVAYYRYIVAPNMIMKLLILPLLLLVLGWWIMQLAGLFLNAKRVSATWTGTARRIVLIVTILCFAALIPPIVWMVWTGIVAYKQGSINAAFPNIPIYTQLYVLVFRISAKFPAVYSLLGGLLWAFGFPKEKKKE